jgi:predicted nuclease of predicted toxin-antitoxin system
MKILLDQNISFKLKYSFEVFFEEVKHVSDFSLHCSDDIDIWNFAYANGYTILTYDADYFDLSIIYGHPPKVIWVRAGNLSTKQLIELLNHQINEIVEFLMDEFTSCIEIIKYRNMN